MSIYVEILIRAPMDALWAHTQTPVLHERWDGRLNMLISLLSMAKATTHAHADRRFERCSGGLLPRLNCSAVAKWP